MCFVNTIVYNTIDFYYSDHIKQLWFFLIDGGEAVMPFLSSDPKSDRAKSEKTNICKLLALWCFNNSFLILFIWWLDFSLRNMYNFINWLCYLSLTLVSTFPFPTAPPWETYSVTDGSNLSIKLKRKSSEPVFFPHCSMREKSECSPFCSTHKSLKNPTSQLDSQQRRNLH